VIAALECGFLEVAHKLYHGVRAIHESDTYLAILDEGRQDQARKLIFRVGTRRFGVPDELIRNTLFAITDLEKLEAIFDRLLDVRSWLELLQLP